MIRHYLEKRWFQYLVLLLLAAAAGAYFTFGFHFGYRFDWTVLYKVNPSYGEILGGLLIDGLALTVAISVGSAALALSLGTVFGLARLSSFRPLSLTASAYVEFFRNTPLLVQLFFWYFALPMGLPEDLRLSLYGIRIDLWGMPVNFEFLTATAGLGIYTGAFMAEIIRAGIQSVPKGLLEAAYSSGLSFPQTLRKVVLPLAFRAIIPPLGSEFLNNMKNSSLAMVVGVAELCWSAQQIKALTFKGFEATSAATVIYLSLSLTIAGLLNLVNLRLKILGEKERGFGHRLAHALFKPLELFSRALGEALRPRPKPASLTLTPFQAAVHRLALTTRTVLVRAGKAGYMAFLVYLLYLLAKGLASLNYQVIGENLTALLIWRFPHGEATEPLMGLGGLSLSIFMSVTAISVSFVIGLFVGMGRTAKNRIVRIPSLLYIELIRGNPLIMVIFWIYFFLPIFGLDFSVFWSATLAMTVFTGAYIAEIVRAGIQNIPRGQFEAAGSTGLTYIQTMRLIILPQALKQMLPAIAGQFIAIFKDTSLAYIIGVFELTYVGKIIANRLMVHPFEMYSTVAVVYFVCCYLMSLGAAKLERRLASDSFRLNM